MVKILLGLLVTLGLGASEVSKKEMTIYCAGPLFNAYERTMMADIAQVFEEAGYKTFLPHRDGIEFSKVIHELGQSSISEEAACKMLSRAIFDLDAYQVAIRCDAVVCSLNGRVPDEGAVSESAIAWCFQKPVIYYKNDSRGLGSLSGHEHDNSLVLGLSQFEVVPEIEQLPDALFKKLANFPPAQTVLHPQGPASLQLKRGEQIWKLIQKSKQSETFLTEFSLLLNQFYAQGAE